MKPRILSLALSLTCLSVPALATETVMPCPAASISLVRHAEKADTDPDTALSPQGQRRAEALVATMAERPLQRIMATHLRRTQHTVLPLARARDLVIEVISAKDFDGLLRRLRNESCGQHVLVAGHSNTLPELMRGLGYQQAPALAEDDYGDLFVLTFERAAPHAPPKVERLRFDPIPEGNPDPG